MRDPADSRTLDLFDRQARVGDVGAILVELCCPACAGEELVLARLGWRCSDCGQLMFCPAERVPK